MKRARAGGEVKEDYVSKNEEGVRANHGPTDLEKELKGAATEKKCFRKKKLG